MWTAYLADCRRQHRAEGLTPLRVVRITVESHGLKALLGYRLGRHLSILAENGRQPLLRPLGWLLYWLISGYARTALGIQLDLSADIGPGLYIGHFGNIVLRRCRLGSHCSIAQSVHIEPGVDGSGPILGDRVWVGAHARIVGGYLVGDRSTVSAGAVVRRDIPSGALFMGNPGRIVMIDYDNSSIL